MSDDTTPAQEKERFPELDNRFGAICISSLIGPPIALLIGAVPALVGSLLHKGFAGTTFDGTVFVVALFSPMMWFIPFVIGIVGLIFTARAKRISLTSVLLTTLLCLLPFCWNVPVMLASALISAALCWRITKNWHSPEPAP